MLRFLYRQLERLGIVLSICGTALLSVSILILLVDIVGRSTVGFSILGMHDVTQLLVMACICLAMPLTFLREGHVGVEFVTDMLGARALLAIKCAVALLCFIFVVALTYFTYAQAAVGVSKGDHSLTIKIPIVWYWAPLLIGLVVSALACLANVLRYALAVVQGQDTGYLESHQL